MRLISCSNDAWWSGSGERAWILILDDHDRDPRLHRLCNVLTEQLRRDVRLDEYVHFSRDARIDPFRVPRNRSLPVVDDQLEPGRSQGLLEPKVNEACVGDARSGDEPHCLTLSWRSIECRALTTQCCRRGLGLSNSFFGDGNSTCARYATVATRYRPGLSGRSAASQGRQAKRHRC